MTPSDNPAIAATLAEKLASDDDWDEAAVDRTEVIELQITIKPGQADAAKDHADDVGADIDTASGEIMFGRARADLIETLANNPAIRRIEEKPEPKELGTSEGVGTTTADQLHSDGIEGGSATIAVIDIYFNPDQSEIQDQVIDTIGSGYYSGTSGLHGTACAEIVAEMCPNADLVLASVESTNFVSLMNSITSNHDPEVMSMSLGYKPTLRLDGNDYLSDRIIDYTSGSGANTSTPGLFAVSAGNEARDTHWDGKYQDNNGYMDFGGNNPKWFEIDSNASNANRDQEVVVQSDADWASDGEFTLELWDGINGNQIASSNTNTPAEDLVVPDGTHYIRIKNNSLNGDEHFDIFAWGNHIRLPVNTSPRSLLLPATSPDSETLTTGAVFWNTDDLENFSSRGPTQYGERGVDIVGPDGTSSDTYGGSFYGTSAACPHVAGAAGLLFDGTSGVNSEIREAMFSTARDINDSSVGSPPNTKIGHGYVDAKAAYDDLEGALTEPLNALWTSNDLGGDAQDNRPVVDANQVYVGGLQNAFYALSRDDGESVGWSKDRGTKPGLSDSSGHLWTDPTQPKVFFGSGQGKLYAVDADDGSEHWSGSDIPDLGSAITSSPTSDGGTIVAGTNDGRVLAWDGSTATQQWEVSVDGGVYSDLTAADGLVYVTTENGTLHVLSASDGTQQWKDSSFGAFGSSSPALGNNSVYVAADEVHAFDAASSKTNQWTSSGYGGTAGSNPTYHNGTVYVGSADGNLYALDAANGSETWRFSTGDAIAATPAINDSGDRIAVASMDATLYLLDSSGNQVETVSIPGDTRASPVIDNGELFLPTASGVTHAFE